MARKRTRKPALLERAYRNFNRRYFGNLLPNPPEIRLRWGDNPEVGYQCGDEIVLNRTTRKWGCVWEWALLHEMVHLYLPDQVVHGQKFQKEMLRLAKAGAFKHLW